MKRKMSLAIILLLFFLVIMMEIQTQLSKAQETANPIPEDAIRLRILANSDSAADQAVKRQIRDAVNADVEQWVHGLKTAKQARQVIRDHLDEVSATVSSKLADMGLDEEFTVKLGQADFPTKMYGGFVYPAGKYEALVITLGKGTGANWWCVLFPPLCFLDFSNGDAVKPEDEQPKAKETSVKTSTVSHKQETASEPEEPEVKFFLIDLFDDIGHFFSSLF